MRFIGPMNLYSKFFDKFEVNMKPLYNCLLNNVNFHWKVELKTMFHQIKTLQKDVTVTSPNTKHPFLNTVDSSLNGTSCARFQRIIQKK